MKNLFAVRPPEAIQDVVRLASVLTAMDSSERPFDAGQYRRLILQLTETLRLAPPGEALDAALAAFPAATTVYENMRYAMAGLCRSSLERNLESERQALVAIRRAQTRKTVESDTHPT